MKKKIITIVLGCLWVAGCSTASHLDQLLTLKRVADEQETVAQYIKDQDKNFDLMLQEMKAGTLEQYSNKEEILQAFGDPVFAREVGEGEERLESWLYRYATQYFGVEKIYLYFDSEGRLVKSEYVEAKNGEIGQEAAPEDGREDI